MASDGSDDVFDLLVARCFPHEMNLREMLEVAPDRVSIKLFDPEGEDIAPTALLAGDGSPLKRKDRPSCGAKIGGGKAGDFGAAGLGRQGEVGLDHGQNLLLRLGLSIRASSRSA
jgi:hypothetical protein